MNHVQHIDLTKREDSPPQTERDNIIVPAVALNAFDIIDAERLSWDVTLYSVDCLDGPNLDEDRGDLRNLFWDLKREARTPGYGFIVDVDHRHVAVPAEWEYPEKADYQGYRIERVSTFRASATNPDHAHIILPILREGIKSHFKRSPSVKDHLGPLWQFYGSFCEVPDSGSAPRKPLFCRTYQVWPELLRGGRWVFKVTLGTRVVDGRTLADYYRTGKADKLAHIIRNRQSGRLTRDNQPLSVNVVHTGDETNAWKMFALADPEQIKGHAELDSNQQQKLASGDIGCKPFKRPREDHPASDLRLVLSSQDTKKHHRETLLSPGERVDEYADVRNASDGMDVFGVNVRWSDELVDVTEFPTRKINSPSIYVKSRTGREVIKPPAAVTAEGLKRRARDRARKIRKHGYVESSNLNPLLACPSRRFSEDRAKRMQRDLNDLLEKQGLPFRFEDNVLYDEVQQIESAMTKGFDSLFAVLPEGSRALRTDDDMHDQIKRRVDVPSQCIQYYNTLDMKWVSQSSSAYARKDGRGKRRLENRYQLALNSFLVKCHWVPFAPADPFHYDVHVGIDVGGPHNNQVVACVGFGFARPEDTLLFYMDDINTDTQKVEPIPPDNLQRGLRQLIGTVRSYLVDNVGERAPDLNRVLFYRDGEFRGQGDAWQELDGIEALHRDFVKKGWVDPDNSTWTAAEVTKRSGYWRILESEGGRATNPLVGRCVFPFDANDEALVCTTGRPYLTQGTASPLRVRVKDIVGNADPEKVFQEIVWEADMCFTKLDMGMSLPWTLNVADTGALQSAKAYKINGIAA